MTLPEMTPGDPTAAPCAPAADELLETRSMVAPNASAMIDVT
ncbi:hypothetical protein WME81_40540 [Sorangium sp. So ce1078]